jgi:diamine N-acetyltransferase
MASSVELVEVTAENWSDVADVEPHDFQREFVAPVTRYLCMAHYERVWHSWAVLHDGSVVGHVMWALDGDEGAHWIGGVVIDAAHQSSSIGREAMKAVIERLRRDEGATMLALAYRPENARARSLYQSLGFVETGETDGDEIVARLVEQGGGMVGP